MYNNYYTSGAASSNLYSSPFYNTPKGSGISNLSLHSVHLSPEELAAIDHGLMSVYGKESEKENFNMNYGLFNTPANKGTNIHNSYNGYGATGATATTNNISTPTPTPSIFTEGKNLSLFSGINAPNGGNNQQYRPQFEPQYQQARNQEARPQFQQAQAQYQQTQTAQNTQNTQDFDGILRQEREKYEKMEFSYRQQLEQLKKNEFGYSEKLKLEQIIQDLRRQIEDLERRLADAQLRGDNSKIEALKMHYDRKIANLVGQFEQEKTSALEIMKVRAKAEINLIIPKLKAQLQANLDRTQSQLVTKIKSQATTYIQKMKQDFQMERQVLIEHLRRKHFEEIKQVKSRLALHFETKLQEERERYNRRSYSDNSDNRQSSTNSYNSLFGEEPSFLL